MCCGKHARPEVITGVKEFLHAAPRTTAYRRATPPARRRWLYAHRVPDPRHFPAICAAAGFIVVVRLKATFDAFATGRFLDEPVLIEALQEAQVTRTGDAQDRYRAAVRTLETRRHATAAGTRAGNA
ncbi:hypothetical protein ACWEQ3_46385 [Streptomyces mirabilis]